MDTENLVGGGVEAEVTEMADDKMKVKKGGKTTGLEQVIKKPLSKAEPEAFRRKRWWS